MATKSRLIANNNWRKKNPQRARKMSYKGTTHTFINKYANYNDLINLRCMINKKLLELKKYNMKSY